MNRFTLSHDSETCSSSPEISSTAFRAQPPNLRFASLIDMGFAIIGRSPDAHASDPVLVHWLALLLHASFRPHLTATPLRFAITSPLSGSEEDFHLQAVEHARRTKTEEPALRPAPYVLNSATRFESQRLEDKLRGQLDQARTLRARPIVYKWP